MRWLLGRVACDRRRWDRGFDARKQQGRRQERKFGTWCRPFCGQLAEFGIEWCQVWQFGTLPWSNCEVWYLKTCTYEFLTWCFFGVEVPNCGFWPNSGYQTSDPGRGQVPYRGSCPRKMDTGSSGGRAVVVVSLSTAPDGSSRSSRGTAPGSSALWIRSMWCSG